MSLAEITAGMANERERERLAEIAELIKRVWVVVTKLSLRTVLREKVQFRARQTKTFVMPAPVSKGVNSQGNSYTTYSNGGYSYSNAPSSSNSNSGSHYYSPSGGTSGFYTQNGERALHLQTRTTNLSSQIVPFRVWQVDNPVVGTPTTRTLQERARTSESCDLSPRRRPPRSACTTREEDAGPIE